MFSLFFYWSTAYPLNFYYFSISLCCPFSLPLSSVFCFPSVNFLCRLELVFLKRTCLLFFYCYTMSSLSHNLVLFLSEIPVAFLLWISLAIPLFMLVSKSSFLRPWQPSSLLSLDNKWLGGKVKPAPTSLDINHFFPPSTSVVFLYPHPASVLFMRSNRKSSFSSHDFVLFLLETFSQIEGGYFSMDVASSALCLLFFLSFFPPFPVIGRETFWC